MSRSGSYLTPFLFKVVSLVSHHSPHVWGYSGTLWGLRTIRDLHVFRAFFQYQSNGLGGVGWIRGKSCCFRKGMIQMWPTHCPIRTCAVNINSMWARTGMVVLREGWVSGMTWHPLIAIWRIVHLSEPCSGIVFSLMPSLEVFTPFSAPRLNYSKCANHVIFICYTSVSWKIGVLWRQGQNLAYFLYHLCMTHKIGGHLMFIEWMNVTCVWNLLF